MQFDVSLQEQQQATQHLLAEMADLQSVSSPATGYIEQHFACEICLLITQVD